MAYSQQASKSLSISSNWIQVPFITVKIGCYTFGVFNRNSDISKDDQDFFISHNNITYPNYITQLSITKINGQVNQYTLSMNYAVTPNDDPNFLEKVFSSVSNTREIVFTYGDMNMPSYIYKEEKAIITKIGTGFDLRSGTIQYTIFATSSAVLNTLKTRTWKGSEKDQPSTLIIKALNSDDDLKALFPGMNSSNYSSLICRDDKAVKIETRKNISALDWIKYLVSCMIPANFVKGDNASTDVYTLIMHDETTYDEIYGANRQISGAYFTVEKMSQGISQSDALVLDIGFGMTNQIVTSFSLVDDENYSLMYNYSTEGKPQYVERIDNNGLPYWEWAPAATSSNSYYMTRPQDVAWYTKLTKYPVKANIIVQGLLRSANLMNYVRLNVIFPGGKKHISSGLYLVTKQVDTIDGQSGYKTSLSLTRIDGDLINS